MQQVPLKSEPPFQRTYAPTLRFMPTELRQPQRETKARHQNPAGSSVVARTSKVRGGGTDRCSKARRRDGDSDPPSVRIAYWKGKNRGKRTEMRAPGGQKAATLRGRPREAGRLAPVHSFVEAPGALLAFGHRGATHLIRTKKRRSSETTCAHFHDPFRSNADQHSNAHHRKAVSVCVRCLFRSLLHGMGWDGMRWCWCDVNRSEVLCKLPILFWPDKFGGC